MDGVTNDVERSNEMVSFIIVTTYFWLPAFIGHYDLGLASFSVIHSARGVGSQGSRGGKIEGDAFPERSYS